MHEIAVGTITRPRRPGAPERASEALARCGAAEAAAADEARLTVLGAAHHLVEVAARGTTRPDPDLLELAAQLAPLAVERGHPHPDADLDGAVVRFEAAIVAAVVAVHRCRTTNHPEGRCRFSATDGVDGCAPLLRAAHELG
ncbi:MAG: hypothetical protein JJT89_06710 [Nitriliruptoraceae bacterium]|nr:hypothetical protein [Nitriliruptoraceae bacterium]